MATIINDNCRSHFCLLETGVPCSPNWPAPHFADMTGLELTVIWPPLPPKYLVNSACATTPSKSYLFKSYKMVVHHLVKKSLYKIKKDN